jgi:hypothetical protein
MLSLSNCKASILSALGAHANRILENLIAKLNLDKKLAGRIVFLPTCSAVCVVAIAPVESRKAPQIISAG